MTPLGRRALIGAAATVGTMAALSRPPSATAATSRPNRLHVWNSQAHFARGGHSGTRVHSTGYLYLGTAEGTTTLTDPHTGTRRTYEYATWDTGEWGFGFGASELIGSWNAETPVGTFVELSLRGKTASGGWSRWFQFGWWAATDGASDIRRASLDGQRDSTAVLDTDTVRCTGSARFVAVRARIRFYRQQGKPSPKVRLVSVLGSVPSSARVTASAPTGRPPITLAVPTYSQEIHAGHYPQWNGGGEAWCSPTSTAMVLDFWKRGPTSSETSWVTQAGEKRPQVDHAARRCYDHTYRGTGNWPFNTAYAGSRGLRSYVTRLRSLVEAETLVRAGIPLIASLSFTAAEMPGAGYGTAGHLLIIVGFTAAGDVVVNDPASALQKSDAQVRRTYRRAAFENAWLPKSGGLVYVIAPWGHRFPAAPAAEPNWW